MAGLTLTANGPCWCGAATETVRMDDALMPWQGRRGNMIDRFDARAMMDFITEYKGPRQ